MTQFTQYKAVEKLSELKRNPIDLTQEGILSPKRVDEMSAQALGIKMLYGTQRVTDKVMDALFELAQRGKCFRENGANAVR